MKVLGKPAVAFAAFACLALLGCATSPRAHLVDLSFPITVDHGAPIEGLTRDGGYGWVYSEINSINFPSNGEGSQSLNVRLVRLDSAYSIGKLIASEKADGLRPADVRELLMFGNTYPDIQRVASIAGLGSPRTYATIEYEWIGMLPSDVMTVISRQSFYPTLAHGLFGRSVVMMQEDMIPGYDPGGFYGCFVQEGN